MTNRILWVIVVFILLQSSLSASPIYTVSFLDPGSAYSQFYSQIAANLLAAGSVWNKFLGGPPISIDLEVKFDALTPRATGGAATSVFVFNNGAYDVFQQGAAAELQSGLDPNGELPDGIITIGPSYLTNELWFDPDPYSRLASIPSNKTDAESVFIHELGHILGFNGYLDSWNGGSPGNFISTYDQYVQFDGNLYFTGPQAEAVFGGPVPLTLGNYAHFGNPSPLPGSELIPDLMNGVVFFEGTRYSPSPLDIALLSDVGVPINAVPEPSSALLSVLGLLVLIALRQRGKNKGTPASGID